MTREEIIIEAAISVLPECKRATPNADKAAAAAKASGEALADELSDLATEAKPRTKKRP